MEKKVRFPLGCEGQAEQIVSSIPKRVHVSEDTRVLVLPYIFSQVFGMRTYIFLCLFTSDFCPKLSFHLFLAVCSTMIRSGKREVFYMLIFIENFFKSKV